MVINTNLPALASAGNLQASESMLSKALARLSSGSKIANPPAAATANALTQIKAAITQVAADRATIGAGQTHINFTPEQLVVSRENLSAASSRTHALDVAEESTQFARYHILVQSGAAMLAQANPLPQTVLRLAQ